MKASKKIKICDWSLLAVMILILASSIQLEATGSRSVVSVWLHIGAGIIFAILIWWHIHLHSAWSKWRQKLVGRHGLKWLSIFGALLLVSAIAATAHWLPTGIHSTIGGVHGKIGFLFVLACTIHAIKHGKFYTNRKPSSQV